MSVIVYKTSPFARKSRTLALVCIFGPALVALIPMAAVPALPAMATFFADENDGQLFAQMIMTAPAVLLILCAPIAGFLASRYSYRKCLLFSLLLYIIGGAGVLFISNSTFLIILRLLLGIAGGGVLTVCLALIGRHFADNAREQLLGYATALASFFATIALILGGALVDHWGWRAPFSLYLLGAPMLVAVWQTLNSVTREKTIKPKFEAPAISQFLSVWPYYALLILLTIGMFSPAIQGPFVLESRGIESAATRGLIVGATSGVAMFSAAFYGFIRRYVSIHTVLATDALCMGVGMIMFSMATDPIILTLGCAIVGIGAGMSEPAIASWVLEKTPIYVRALAMGLIVSALNFGQFMNPLIFDPLRQSRGIDDALSSIGALLITVGIFVAIYGWCVIKPKQIRQYISR